MSPPQHNPQQPRPLNQAPPLIPTPQPQGLQALLSSRNLAEIIAKAQKAPSAIPATQAQIPPPQQTPTSFTPGPPQPGGDLLAMLRANGMLAAGSTPINGTNTPNILSTGTTRPTLINDVELTSASLKRYVLLLPLVLQHNDRYFLDRDRILYRRFTRLVLINVRHVGDDFLLPSREKRRRPDI